MGVHALKRSVRTLAWILPPRCGHKPIGGQIKASALRPNSASRDIALWNLHCNTGVQALSTKENRENRKWASEKPRT